MAAAEVVGNDATIALAARSGNFQLNVMLPLVADKLLGSIELLAGACDTTARRWLDSRWIMLRSGGYWRAIGPGHRPQPADRL